MRVIAPFISFAAWWNMRRVRRAEADFRKATFYAIRAERTLVAVGLMPARLTDSGLPAVPQLPNFRR